MNRKLCAPANRAQSWESIDWKKAEAYVKKLQMRMHSANWGLPKSGSFAGYGNGGSIVVREG